MYRPFSLVLGLTLSLSLGSVHAAHLAGKVTDTDGQPLGNVMVTLRHATLEKSVTVYSNAEGHYQLPLSDTGLHDLRVRRIGYAPVTEAAIDVAADSRLNRDVQLKPVPKSLWVHELPASDWFGRIAFSQPELRAQFAIQCAMCHQQGSSTTRLPRSEQDWKDIFNLMGEFGAVMTQTLYDEAPAALNATFDYANLDLDSFPDQPAVLDPKATDVLITEWDVGHPTAFLHDMVVGQDNIIYSVDWIGDKFYALDPATNTIKAWAIPTDDLGHGGILGIMAERGRRYLHHTPTVAPHSLQVGPDGKIWITLSIGRGLARFDPVTETFSTHNHPSHVMYPHTLRFDQQGNVWYTVSMTNHVVRYTPSTDEFKVYELPTRNWTQWAVAKSMRLIVWAANAFNQKGSGIVSDTEINPVPYGIDITPDGKVWFSQFNDRRIGFIDPATDAITMIDTPFYGPRRLRADSTGALWIPSYNEGEFYRFDPATRAFSAYRVPTGKGDMVYALAIDPRDDSVWLCGTNSDSIIHFDPASEGFTTYQLPTRVSFTRELEVDEAGNVWTSISNMPYYQVEGARGKIVRLSFPAHTTTELTAHAH